MNFLCAAAATPMAPFSGPTTGSTVAASLTAGVSSACATDHGSCSSTEGFLAEQLVSCDEDVSMLLSATACTWQRAIAAYHLEKKATADPNFRVAVVSPTLVTALMPALLSLLDAQPPHGVYACNLLAVLLTSGEPADPSAQRAVVCALCRALATTTNVPIRFAALRCATTLLQCLPHASAVAMAAGLPQALSKLLAASTPPAHVQLLCAALECLSALVSFTPLQDEAAQALLDMHDLQDHVHELSKQPDMLLRQAAHKVAQALAAWRSRVDMSATRHVPTPPPATNASPLPAPAATAHPDAHSCASGGDATPARLLPTCELGWWASDDQEDGGASGVAAHGVKGRDDSPRTSAEHSDGAQTWLPLPPSRAGSADGAADVSCGLRDQLQRAEKARAAGAAAGGRSGASQSKRSDVVPRLSLPGYVKPPRMRPAGPLTRRLDLKPSSRARLPAVGSDSSWAEDENLSASIELGSPVMTSPAPTTNCAMAPVPGSTPATPSTCCVTIPPQAAADDSADLEAAARGCAWLEAVLATPPVAPEEVCDEEHHQTCSAPPAIAVPFAERLERALPPVITTPACQLSSGGAPQAAGQASGVAAIARQRVVPGARDSPSAGRGSGAADVAQANRGRPAWGSADHLQAHSQHRSWGSGAAGAMLAASRAANQGRGACSRAAVAGKPSVGQCMVAAAASNRRQPSARASQGGAGAKPGSGRATALSYSARHGPHAAKRCSPRGAAKQAPEAIADRTPARGAQPRPPRGARATPSASPPSVEPRIPTPLLPAPLPCQSPRRRSSRDELLRDAAAELGDFLLPRGSISLTGMALGEGGFSHVWQGTLYGVDSVAVKVAKKAEPSPSELRQFIQEVKLMRRLHHRNIVQAYGVCIDPGQPCLLVTELMRGGDLHGALRAHPELLRWEGLGRKVALDVAIGLNHLHCQTPPVMHRDLKSPNVLLSEEGLAKIADVGMSRAQEAALVTAQPVMSPLWAAPEVVAKQRASVKCDMWSFGVIVWELATGEDITYYPPLAISRQLGAVQAGRAMAMPPTAPAIACRIFDACTRADPATRPTAAEVVSWLQEEEDLRRQQLKQ